MIDEERELLIQKCVDGELDVETQQQLLAQLDVMNEGWKVLALAYVEEQTWTSSFNENDRVAQQLEHEAFAQSLQQMVDAESQEVQCFMPASTSSASSNNRSRLLTQVTCLAIALVGGVLIGDIWRSRTASGGGGVDVANQSKKDTPLDPVSNLDSEPDSLALSLPGRDGQAMTVQAYPSDQFRQFPTTTPQSELRDIEAELWRQGLRLQESQAYIGVELQDGRRAFMPVSRWKVRPGGQ
ncbi:MAG: hypothetical protein AB8G99_04920 [Planctomycetaceae bacterium]